MTTSVEPIKSKGAELKSEIIALGGGDFHGDFVPTVAVHVKVKWYNSRTQENQWTSVTIRRVSINCFRAEINLPWWAVLDYKMIVP